MADNWALQEYDADQIRATAFGFSISKGAGASGYAESGPFVTIEPKNPSFTSKEGVDGTVARSKTNSRLVKIMVRTLQTNAATNNFLSTQLANDEAGPNGAGIGTFNLEDLNGTTKFSGSKVWIVGPPKQSWDKEAGTIEWELEGLRSVLVVGGN